MNFGQNLKKLRKEAKLTQSQLADKLGMKQNAYVLWEQKATNPTLELLEKLADIYDLPIQELIKNPDNGAEKQLIDNYRSLTGEQQESVINFTDFLIEQNKADLIDLKTYRRSSLQYAVVEDEALSAGFGQQLITQADIIEHIQQKILDDMMALPELKVNPWNQIFQIFLLQHSYTQVLDGVEMSMPLLKEIWEKNAYILSKYLKKKTEISEFIHSIQTHNTRTFI